MEHAGRGKRRSSASFRRKHDLSSGGRAIELVGLDAEVALPSGCRPASPNSTARSAAGSSPGSAMLIGGDPGIGKSTLLLQAAAQAGARRAAASSMSRARKPPTRCGCARARLGLGAGAGPARRRDLGARHPDHARQRQAARLAGDRFDPDHAFGPDRGRARHRQPGARLGAGADPLRQGSAAPRSCSSATSPRTAPSPARACSNIWSTPCSASKASAATSTASCARPRTASAAPTRSACSRWTAQGLERSAQPVGAVPHPARRAGQRAPRCSRRSKARARCWSKSRR